ncbi:MAG: serine/threonine-protein kinase [Chthoniobacterales bacterium]|nr:serine/threonine-protein kinase [Chthoniobacterales bacterium]
MSASTPAARSPQLSSGNVEGSATKPAKSWFSGGIFSCFFGHNIAEANPQPGAASRATAQQAASLKFKISSSWWSGTKITIPTRHITTTAFQGSSKDAQELLQQLTQLKGKGMLVLKPTGDPEKGMEFQYRNFWIKPSVKQREETGAYIESLLQKAYPDRENFSKNRNNLQQIFSDYLSSTRTPITQDFSSLFKSAFETHLAPYNVATALQTKEIEQISTGTTPVSYLQSRGVSIGKEIGQGSFGKVYAAKIGSKDYVYKEQTVNEFLTDDPELNGKWHRTGDIAASRCKDLAHFAKSTAFVLEITKAGEPPQLYYVTADQTKDFGKTLPKGTKVKLVGQLMEKAPGTELGDLLDPKKNPSFKPAEHFDGIANSLFGFLEKSYTRNLIHRDLKVQNFIYDPKTKQGTVIDFGLGGVYGKRRKMSAGRDTTSSNNPLLSSHTWGSQDHMAPAVVKGELYGSEVDFHSAAVMLIKSLDPQCFETAKKSFFTQVRNKNGQIVNERIIPSKIPTSTAEYLRILGPNSKLAQAFRKDPSMQKTIDLFFGVASAKPEKRDNAFQTLKTHMETLVRPAIQRQQQQSRASSQLTVMSHIWNDPNRQADSDDDSDYDLEDIALN